MPHSRLSDPRPESGRTAALLLVGVLAAAGAFAAVLATAARSTEPPAPRVDLSRMESDLQNVRTRLADALARLDDVAGRLSGVEAELAKRSTAGSPAAAPAAVAAEAASRQAPDATEAEATVADEAVEAKVERAIDRRERVRSARAFGIDLETLSKESGLTDEQADAVATLLDRWRGKLRELRPRRRPETEEEREAVRASIGQQITGMRDEILTEAREILTPAQLTTFETQLSMPGPGGGGGPGRRGR